MSYWLNFGEDGALAWWLHRIKVGCIFRHNWVESRDYVDEYFVEGWRECASCGQFGGYLDE